MTSVGVTEMYTWYDDMHPDSDGFRALAHAFATHTG